jgi:anti-sigma factor RsiW
VSCELCGSLLHAYLDSELDVVRAAEFERHLETCSECRAALAASQSLRTSFQRAQLLEMAPLALRQKVRAEVLPSEVSPRMAPVPLWRWLAVAATLVLVTSVAWYAIPRLSPANPASNANSGTPSATELVDAHIRSLQAGHLTDVLSTDQHTVKPWFDGKLDFIPPVQDYTQEGFPLVGGRLDVLAGHNVAALVYGRRKHMVNVFVWPTKEPDSPIHGPGTRQGFQWVHWRHKGLEFCAVSDANGDDLREIAQLFNKSADQ